VFSADQLVAHAIGDYVLQNHWMALRKTSSSAVALVHAVCYTLPFALFFGLSWALVPICLTHAVIDRFRLARLWVDAFGIGQITGVARLLPGSQGLTGAPPFLAVWLLIIVDNVAHVACNALSLGYLS